jgi:DNA primase
VFPYDCDTAILVEGSLDAMWMHQLGFKNTLAILTAKISAYQILILKQMGIRKIVLFLDNDAAGFAGMEDAYKKLKNDFIIYTVEYPKGRKDPQTLTQPEIKGMLDNKSFYKVLKLRKLD